MLRHVTDQNQYLSAIYGGLWSPRFLFDGPDWYKLSRTGRPGTGCSIQIDSPDNRWQIMSS